MPDGSFLREIGSSLQDTADNFLAILSYQLYPVIVQFYPENFANKTDIN